MVVVSVIAILAVIVTVGYSAMQKHSRDTERSTKTQLIAAALEDYYDKNGEYPSCPALTDDGDVVVEKTLRILDNKSSLRSPNAGSDVSNSITCDDLGSVTSATEVFSYTGDDSNACRTGSACKKWTLRIRAESGETIEISSRHTS